MIAFNGEIYNHLQLRNSLGEIPDGYWRGHSDTETLLAGFSKWGVQRTLERTVGMFAIALWDRETRTLTLARDRMGEKPLYYGWQGSTFLFGSELKSFRHCPAFAGEIRRDAISLLLRHNYVPAPYSIYENIHKLLPGTFLQIATDTQSYRSKALSEPQPYWSLQNAVKTGELSRFRGSDSDAINILDERLRETVRDQMVADVPLGAFLSGGVDSSTIVAIMQAQSVRPVKTFSIGFYEEGYNEAEYAKDVARHLKTEHTELYVSSKAAQDVIPLLPSIYDEPFSDSSQIPTFLVSQLAHQHVTVSLSGDGGDELFCGYNRYSWGKRLWSNLAWVPYPLRSATAHVLTAVSPMAWNRVFALTRAGMPARFRYSNPGHKLHKLAELLAVRSPEGIYKQLVSHWSEPASVVRGAQELPTLFSDDSRWSALSEFEERMMYIDTLTYLPDDILVKVDRAAMAVSLETRVPFLDHRVAEFAWSLPHDMKVRRGERKWILRQVLSKYVPRELIERPKMGFGVPIDSWLRGPLREWAEELLAPSRLHNEGYFQPGPIRERWEEHLSGRKNWQYHLWDVLMFQAWLERQKGAN